jgi:TonB family protein
MPRIVLFPLLLVGLALGQEQFESHRKAIEKITPRYPEMARTLKLSGSVKIAVRVAPNGKVISAEILGGHPLLAQVAVDAVRQWRFALASQETEEVVSFTFQP